MILTSPQFRTIVAILCSLPLAPAARAAADGPNVVHVRDDDSFRRAVAGAKPGSRIVLAAGTYRPGVSAKGLTGTADAPIVIEGADGKNPPVFEGGPVGLHLSDCAHLTLRDILVRGQSGNGVNIDDGGTFDTPSHHVTLERVRVEDVGPEGNRDAIKLSGVDDLRVIDCTVEGWGGQGIDMVGCHRVRVEGCTFRGKSGFGQQIAVQAKGGSSDVTVRRCTFLDVGQRGVNLGGSTNPKLFRPPGARYEAKDVTVEGCRFVGGMAPVAFVGVDGAAVRFNTIYRPEKWVVRILQENTADEMVPSRGGRFERNLVVYGSAAARSAVNVGPKTEPAGFVFRENLWYCEDRPDRSRPQTPAAEQGGVYGVDPQVRLSEQRLPSPPAAAAARGFGAGALPEAGARSVPR